MHEQSPFHQVFQLADIAWEGERLQVGDGICRGFYVWKFVGGTSQSEEVFHQQGDVLAAFAEGRQVQVDEIDAEEQVLAEGVFFHHLAQVNIRGADDADIGAACVAVAQHLVSLVLQHTQELHLAG